MTCRSRDRLVSLALAVVVPNSTYVVRYMQRILLDLTSFVIGFAICVVCVVFIRYDITRPFALFVQHVFALWCIIRIRAEHVHLLILDAMHFS